MDGGYEFVARLPVTVMNAIWLVMSCLLALAYLTNHVIKPDEGNWFGLLTKYLIFYGKAKRVSQSTDVPKRFFVHFYIAAVIYNFVCLVTIIGLSLNQLSTNWISDVFHLHETSHHTGDQLSVVMVMALLTIHTSKRLYECLFVSVFSKKAKLTPIHYAWGFVYYLLLPPTLIAECLPLYQLPFGSFELRHFIGIIGFCVASYIHHTSHTILADMRKKGGCKQDSHGIPHKGMFEYVSCPHYFAEVLIYVFTALIVWPQCHSWLLLLAYNTIVHANMSMISHVWYKETFPSYPAKRKAFIPFLF